VWALTSILQGINVSILNPLRGNQEYLLKQIALRKRGRTKITGELWVVKPLWRCICCVGIVDRRWNEVLIILADGKPKKVIGHGKECRRKLSVFVWNRIEVLQSLYIRRKYVLVRRRRVKPAI
jgi:hypothetical protein